MTCIMSWKKIAARNAIALIYSKTEDLHFLDVIKMAVRKRGNHIPRFREIF
ncbi:hypothetical protein [Bdellovibrio svalbardensis]|uniref:Uncharacterized protein n=1 Tax=Bdellovibrio svalbardensis TaxID=2972972 RepID=A0ABT6DNF3_9BACT|nr:hypothetical protein [Bdellovibrio svalbardensis]MDG0818154.1 hypothetical protein [Bdellovibrio svalbardensis]